ncbi:MAG: tRNA pseudouridine(38-40) synthase TruA [Ferruginibacter sp.]|nr:tRNA pseudouridine(38-40) synthase TruA [Ferruginibacter sp.]
MARYFIEVSYKGTAYAGFQVQQNANTIQAEIEKALLIYFRKTCTLTGSSRTDAGVHAQQNFFHFDSDTVFTETESHKAIYHLNAILPLDIAVKNIKQVAETAHCRFDAVFRSYRYCVHRHKNPFLLDNAYYYPYPLDMEALHMASKMLLEFTDFESFAKKNTQVFTYNCTIFLSEWILENDMLVYTVTGNRFLRGMVRGLVGTMLLVGKGKYSVQDFKNILESKNSAKADFSAPAKGLVLVEVKY